MKRIRTLLIPFAVWTVIGFVVVLPRQVLAAIVAGRSWMSEVEVGNLSWWLNVLGLDFSKGHGTIGALWYLRSLFVLVACSPIFKWLLDRLGRGWLGIAYFGLLVYQSSWLPIGSWWNGFFGYTFSLEGIFYFSLGIYLNRKDVGARSRCFLPLCAFVAGFLLLYLEHYQQLNFVSMRTLSIPLFLFGFWNLTPSVPWPKFLTGATFPIYLMHMLLISLIRAIPLPGGGYTMWVLCLTIPILLVALLPRKYATVRFLLWGGR